MNCKRGVFITVYVLATLCVKAGKSVCPTPCRCEKDLVDCRGCLFTFIPMEIPLTTLVLLLDNNEITHFNKMSFEKLDNLHHLGLSGNYISKIQKNVFKPLSNLTYMDLSGNRINGLENDSFAGLVSLVELRISSNHLYDRTAYEAGVFEPLKKLKKLELVNNCMMDSKGICDYPDHTFIHLHSLVSLTMDAPTQMGLGFKNLTSIEDLTFTGNCVYQYLSNESLLYVNRGSVKSITFSSCVVRVGVQEGIFSTFVNLKVLNFDRIAGMCEQEIINSTRGLDSTNISAITFRRLCSGDRKYSEDVFKGLAKTNLKSIVWFQNSALAIKTEACSHLPVSITNVSFSEPRLHQSFISSIILSCFKNIQVLYLSGDIHKPVYDLGIQGHTQPTRLQLFEKTTLNKSTISLPKTLKRIYISSVVAQYVSNPDFRVDPNNSVELIDLSMSTFYGFKGVFYGFHQLKYLNISNCGMHVPGKFLTDMPNLIRLDLSGNNLRYLLEQESYEQMFVNQTKLESLNLRRNGIRQLSNNIFQNQINLEELILSENSLQVISFRLDTLVSLKKLDLSGNNINYLSEQSMLDLTSISAGHTISINLLGNNLECTCDRMNFLNMLGKANLKLDPVQNMTCLYRNGSMIKITNALKVHEKLQIGCYAGYIVIGCVFLFFGMCIMCSLLVVIHDNRWRLRYLYYMGRPKVNPYQPLEDSDTGRDRAIYFSFDEDFEMNPGTTMRKYMYDKIRSSLAEKGICVHFRYDITPGQNMFHAVSSLIRKSRKVVVVLSKDYSKEYWNTYEFNMASFEGAYKRERLVICFAVDDVTSTDLSEEMLHFFRATSIYRFPGPQRHDHFIDFLTSEINQTD